AAERIPPQVSIFANGRNAERRGIQPLQAVPVLQVWIDSRDNIRPASSSCRSAAGRVDEGSRARRRRARCRYHAAGSVDVHNVRPYEEDVNWESASQIQNAAYIPSTNDVRCDTVLYELSSAAEGQFIHRVEIRVVADVGGTIAVLAFETEWVLYSD